MAAASAMQGMDGQMYEFQGTPLTNQGCESVDFEAFDFGLGGIGMGMDGAITELFMENGGIWSNSVPGFCGPGWHG